MAEKRLPNRSKKRLKVRFGVERLKALAFTGDVSADGIYIITPRPEEPGCELLLELILPGGVLISAHGQVRWSKKVPPNLVRVASKAGMGVRFLRFDSGEQAWQDYISSL